MKITSDHGIVKLIQGDREQSVWRRDTPDLLVNSYVRLVALASLTWPGYIPRQKGRALIIGLGGGILCRFLIRHFPNLAIEVVEPNKRVVEIAEQYFELDHRVHVNLTDGRGFMSGKTGTFDLIILDAFDKTYIPADMMTAEFLHAAKTRLRPGGILVANTWVLKDITKHENATYASVFNTIWDFRKLPNIDGNRILLYNPLGADRLDKIIDLVRDRAAFADQRAPLKSKATDSRMYYSGLTDRLRIQQVQAQKNGIVLTDANIRGVRAQSSFDE